MTMTIFCARVADAALAEVAEAGEGSSAGDEVAAVGEGSSAGDEVAEVGEGSTEAPPSVLAIASKSELTLMTIRVRFSNPWNEKIRENEKFHNFPHLNNFLRNLSWVPATLIMQPSNHASMQPSNHAYTQPYNHASTKPIYIARRGTPSSALLFQASRRQLGLSKNIS